MGMVVGREESDAREVAPILTVGGSDTTGELSIDGTVAPVNDVTDGIALMVIDRVDGSWWSSTCTTGPCETLT